MEKNNEDKLNRLITLADEYSLTFKELGQG